MQQALFELSFDKPFSTLLALIPALLNLYIIIYVALYMPRKTMTQVFALFVFALFLWQVDDVMARMSRNFVSFDAWNTMLCLGWILFAPLGLYFALLYTGFTRLVRRPGAIFVLFAPCVVFEAVYVAGIIPHFYVYDHFWGWVEPHNRHLGDKLLVLWLAIQVLLMLSLLVRHALRPHIQPIARRQALIIALGISIPAVQGIITQVLSPIFFHDASIPVTSTFMSFFSVGSFLALNRYKLFNLAEAVDTQMLLNSLTDIVFTVSPQERITYINPHGVSLLGISHTLAEGMRFSHLFGQDRAELARFQSEVLRPALAGQTIDNIFFTLKRDNAEPIWVLVSADPIRDNQTIHGVLLVARNVTEIKKAEDQIRAKNAELERSNKELEQFAYIASHDMKEPLRMVSNYTQLLAHKYYDKLDESAKEYIDYAVDGVHRMQALINDLLNYSRIGRVDLTPQEVDCNKLMQEIIRGLQTIIIETGANIEYDKLPVLNISRTQMSQLLQNLIENGIKFHKPEVAPHIRVSAQRQDDQWLFSISDNGIGINEAYKQKVFTIFQRLHDRRQYPGTGIGLAVCKKIVELYHGQIWFESQEGKGTTFYFTLQA